MNLKLKQFILILCFGLLFVGCATLFDQKEQSITINSDPQGADVYIDGIKEGQTPMTFKIGRNTFDKTYLTVKKDSFNL